MNKRLTNNTARWLWKVSGRTKMQIGVILVLQMILGVSSVGYALLLRYMIDAAVDSQRDNFVTGIVSLLILVLCQIIMKAICKYLEEDARTTIENQLKNRLFSTLLRKDYASVTAVHSGEWMNRLTSDTVIVADGFVQILPGVAGMGLRMAAAIGMIIVLIPWFGAVIVPGAMILLGASYFLRRHMKNMHRKIQEKDGKLRVFLQEHLGSLLVVRSFAKEEQVLIDAVERMEEHKKARMKRMIFSNVTSTGFSIAVRGVYLFGAIYCAYGIMKGSISVGTLTAILQLIAQAQGPITSISGFIPRYYSMIASAERLCEAEKFENDCPKGLYSSEIIHRFYEKEFSAIGMRNAFFTYLPPTRDIEADLSETESKKMPVVLENVDFELRKGDYAAFTGYSGSGKSTILKLMMCLYSLDSGERYLKTVDGNEQELSSSWHRLFAYVPQGNHLMSGTIREIISFFDKEKMKDVDSIKRAISIACADEFVDTLEDGIDTFLGERGQGLSEGQMQRIAIARAVFSDNPILILDESTSALDEKTEQKVLENLKKMTDKTVMIVTHRPAALSICNRRFLITEKGFFEVSHEE